MKPTSDHINRNQLANSLIKIVAKILANHIEQVEMFIPHDYADFTVEMQC